MDLEKQGLAFQKETGWGLTVDGWKGAKRIVKVHRLWEMYLNKHLRISSDHVHDDADTIEHFISPELERELENLLAYPDEDPHHTKIPYI
jgi:manganese/zinc/iron transport system permease protein